MSRTIKVEIEFSEDHLDQILEFQYFGDEEPPTVASLTDEQFAQLAAQIQATSGAFAVEIVDSSLHADDWLADFMALLDCGDE